MIDSLFGTDFDWRDIDIIFTRNIPSNDTDIATVVSALKDTVSDETLLAQVPFVDNVQDEMERLKKQKEENPFYSTSLVYRT
jgi:SPP1 family phage portal protein